VWGESRALQWKAYVFTETGTGTREEFLEIIQGAIARARDSGDRARIAFSLVGLAIGLMGYSQRDKVESILQEAEELYSEIDSYDGICAVRFLRTQNFFARGDLEKAKAEARKVIEYWNRAGERNQQSTILSVLALIAEAEHDLQSAVAYAQKALELAREMRLPLQIAWALVLIGTFKYQQGQVEVALEYVRDSLEFVRRGDGLDNLVVKIFDHLAGLLVEKKTQPAVQILAFTESLVRLSAVRRDPIFDQPYLDRFLSAARAKLSEAEFRSAWEAGSKISHDEAITCILRELQ
jgi:tetratricopeptide (TPR) repeat protein